MYKYQHCQECEYNDGDICHEGAEQCPIEEIENRVVIVSMMSAADISPQVEEFTEAVRENWLARFRPKKSDSDD